MWRNMPHTPQTKKWRMRFACSITKVTDEHSEYAKIFAFLHQQWLSERISKWLLYTQGLSCFLAKGIFHRCYQIRKSPFTQQIIMFYIHGTVHLRYQDATNSQYFIVIIALHVSGHHRPSSGARNCVCSHTVCELSGTLFGRLYCSHGVMVVVQSLCVVACPKHVEHL
jgi:hypothetical protein